MGLGEISNFAAYAFAPAILVTPLGALSVLVGYGVLSWFILFYFNLILNPPLLLFLLFLFWFLLFLVGGETLTDGTNSAVLGTYFLKETLGTLGKLGCAICLIGSVIIVLHAPADEQIDRIDEMLNYAIQPGLLCPFPPGPLRVLHAYRLKLAQASCSTCSAL